MELPSLKVSSLNVPSSKALYQSVLLTEPVRVSDSMILTTNGCGAGIPFGAGPVADAAAIRAAHARPEPARSPAAQALHDYATRSTPTKENDR